ncbi:MAG TPA: lantibiotic dehydratase [Pyrinomonadaceae bacterium]|nr:lantibiotic dehydratase [Pyrinomonadaceae bacterium]
MSTSTIELREDPETQLPDHLLSLPGGEWALWRSAVLRGAGFPSTNLLKLAAPEIAAAADWLISVETDARQLQQQALQSLREQLHSLPGEFTEAEKALKSSLSKAIKKLTRGDLPPTPVISSTNDSLAAYEAARLSVDQARSAYDEAFNNGLASLSRNIKQVAEGSLFREAVTWQNRHALKRAIDSLLRMPDSVRHAERRGSEELVAKYLQRYAVKNDTIGFFGPVGWARLDETEESLQVEMGPELIEARGVYLEVWCVDALMQKLNAQPALRPWMTPRRLPTIRLEGMTLHHPVSGTRKISFEQKTVLDLCDGRGNAKELARQLMNSHPTNFKSEALVYGLLQALRDKALIFWGFEVPYELHPERELRNQLSKIDDENLREMTLAPLDELELARDGISRAAGDSEKLDEAFANFETTFSRLTDQAPTRGAGKLYAARTLVYEDCRRGIDVVLGRKVLERLEQPLSLLLSSCRWLTSEMAKIYRAEFKKVYQQLVAAQGKTQVDALAFWLQAHPLVFTDRESLLANLVTEFQARWADILGFPLGENRVQFQSGKLRPRVSAAFDAPAPGWSTARHHSPDLMIVAESVEAIQRGEFHFVMGELHVGTNTLGASSFCSQHPAPNELLDYLESDLPGATAVPMQLAEFLTSRTTIRLVSRDVYRIEIERESFTPDRSRALPIADLLVEECAGELMVRTRDGRLSFEIVEVFGGLLSGLVVDLFKLLPSASHTPRVTIDDLTIMREGWNFGPATMSWAFVKDESERYLACKRWAEELKLPGRVFVKVPVESKPFYIDLESPVYVNVLSRMVRRTLESEGEKGVVKLTEMMPGIEQVWLPDAAGNRYTSELRIVALDLASPDPTH